VRPETGGLGHLRVVEPDEPCDRCEHPSKFHAGPEHGSECRIVEGRFWRGERVPRGMRAKQCLCDGFAVRP
jgi:hypothetical protein